MQTQIETLFPICDGWTCRWGRPSCRSEWFRAWRWQTAPLTQCAHGPLPRAPAAAHLTKEARGCAACASALATVLANDHTLAGFARCPQLVWFVKQKSLWVPGSSSGPQKAEVEMSAVEFFAGGPAEVLFPRPSGWSLQSEGRGPLPSLTVNSLSSWRSLASFARSSNISNQQWCVRASCVWTSNSLFCSQPWRTLAF